jgi:hypothetical protein
MVKQRRLKDIQAMKVIGVSEDFTLMVFGGGVEVRLRYIAATP